MANPYTKPVQSQFIPTYQPINQDAVNIAAQAMQKRQDKNLAEIDRLQQQASQLEGKLFEEDKPVFKREMENVRSQLDQMAMQGDVSDARRKIRGLARKFKDKTQSEGLGKAFSNFAQVQNKFKQIDDSDLPDTVKQRRKDAIIANYKGVEGGGGLDMRINTDYIDKNEWVDERISDMSPSEIAKETGWTWRPKLGKFQKGNIEVSQIPTQAIQQVVENSIANDPEAQSALQQQALAATAGQEEFTIQEDGETKIISRDEMVKRKMDQEMQRMVETAQTKFRGLEKSISTDVTTPSKYASGAGLSEGYTTHTSGITRVKDMGITSLDQGFDEMRSLEVAGHNEAAEDMESTLNLAFMNFQNSSKDISKEDAEFLKETSRHVRNIKSQEQPAGTQGLGIGNYPGSSTVSNIGRSVRDELGDKRFERYQRLKGKFDDWLEKGGGYTQSEVSPDNSSPAGNAAFERIQDTIERSSPGNWRVYGQPEEDQMVKSTEGLSENARSRLDSFKFKSAVFGNEYNPTMITGYWLDENGEEQRVNLVYQRGGLRPGQRDPMDQILSTLGLEGQQAMEDRRYEHIEATTDFKNIRDQLPIGSNNEYVAIKRVPEGYQSAYGNENDKRPFTEGAVIQSIMKYADELKGSASEILNEIDTRNPGILTDEEKGFILEGGLQDPTGDEKEMAKNIERKLAAKFTTPYTFNNKRVASEIAAKTKL